MRSLHIALALMSYFTLSGAGCVPETPAPTVKPPARCMAPIEKIPRPILGEDGNAYKGRLIGHSKIVGSIGRCLQRYVKTATE